MSQLKIVPLGGMGRVTQNMFLYEYENEILIVDCGIGFPDTYMPGVDILIPDITYLIKRLDEGAKIVGMILSHGHDDHIAATPYLLPTLPDFPIFASPLTAAFAENRMKEGKLERKIRRVTDTKPVTIGAHFSARLFAVTHSVPDTRHIVINTPEGVIYHGSDFKLDPAPVDGVLSDLEGISQLKDENVLCMMIDCLRVEYDQWVKSESATGPVIERIMRETQGKYVITLMSSHIHRIQQTVNAAKKLGRKVVFIGRSVEQNVRAATEANKLTVPKDMLVDKRDIDAHDDNKLCLIVAGSQGQEGSTLMRAIYGEHRVLRITKQDTVVFSADAIPGNELSYFGAIDELSRNGIKVLYPTIVPDLHESGHASTPEQQEIVGLVQPEYVMPIGGQDRHRALFVERVAKPGGFSEDKILLPKDGEVMSFSNRTYKKAEMLNLRPQAVDGLGVGDVGPVVLSDRRTLGQSGIVVVVLPRKNKQFLLKEMSIVSRGFVFMKEADEVIDFIKKTAAEVIHDNKKANDGQLTRKIDNKVSRKLYKIIEREPMIVPVILDL